MGLKKTKDDFIKSSVNVHGNLYDYSLSDYKNNKTPVDIICSIHGIFKQRPDAHIFQKQKCPRCQKILNKKDFIEKSNKIHNNIFDYSIINYVNSKIKVEIKCIKHGSFFIRPNDHLMGIGCPLCNKSFKMIESKFIEISNKIHNNKYDYSLLKYINCNTKVNVICKEHGIFEIKPLYHVRGGGCQKCSKVQDIDNFINKSNKMHNFLYDYSKSIFKGSNIKLEIICKIHGSFFMTPNKHLIGQGCSSCKSSKGEKEIEKILKHYKLSYIKQHVFENCFYKNKLKFDFYVDKYNFCIEYDGEQHFMPINHWGGIEKYDIIIERDKMKNVYCYENHIKLLRIRYDENIEYKINDFLKTII